MNRDQFMQVGAVLFLLMIAFANGCAHTQGKRDSSVGPARAPISSKVLDWLASGRLEDKPSDAKMYRELTRSQRVVYGTHYIDFFATLETLARDPGEPICFNFRIETDDPELMLSGLKWDAYLIRAGLNPMRVNFESFLSVPTNKYPLVSSAKGCAKYEVSPKYPIYMEVTPLLKPGIDTIRLEWYLQ